MTWWFDDLEVGSRIEGGARTITDTEIATLPALMGVVSPLFHDEVTAARGPMGGRILYGPALLGIAIGLTEQCFHESALGLRGLTDVKFLAPARPGDTVSAALTVKDLSTREGSRGGRVVVEDEVVNQNGERILAFTRTLLLKRRGED